MASTFHSLDDPELIHLLQTGAVGVLPTDTVYGLVCIAKNEQSAKRLYTLKSRELKPGTLIAASISQIVDLGIPKRYLKAVEHFWPGSISVIVPCDEMLSHLHLGKMSLAVRIPADEFILSLLEKVGPLLTTSANHPGELTARNIEEARGFFGESVDFYVDNGEVSERPPSTIIRVIDDEIEVVRKGAVRVSENGEILPIK